MPLPELNDEVLAEDLKLDDFLYDPMLAGTHGQRIVVQWLGQHKGRGRTYVAGVEELSRHPVQLAYDNEAKVKIYRRP